MATYEIPLSSQPQTFNITLSSVTYQLTVQYRNAGGTGWVVDIADINGAKIVTGIPLVTGTNLLEQYDYLGFKGRLWVQGAGNPDNVPTFEDLGTLSHLLWVTDD